MKPLTAAQQNSANHAHKLRASGRMREALAVAEKLAENAPGTPDAQLLLGICRAGMKDFSGSEAAFRKALELAPAHPLILVNFATVLRQAGRFGDAMRTYNLALSRDPNLPGAWLGLASCARRSGDPAKATQAVEEHLKRQPRSAAGWYECGLIERGREAYESARDAFSRAAELDSNQGIYDAGLGVTERLIGRPESALDCFERASRKGYINADVENTRIGALLDCGRIEEAYRNAKGLLEAQPDHIPTYHTMADILWEYGAGLENAPDPADLMRGAIDRVSDKRAMRRALAEFLLKAKRNDEAIEIIESLRAEDDHPILMTLQANALESLRRVEASGALYRRAYSLLGDSRADFLCAYIRHLLRVGEWREAEARACAAVDIAPDNQEAWAYLATAWRLLGNEREFWLCDYERAITFIEVPPPEQFANLEAYLESLRRYLDSLHQASREPLVQSLRNGSQTSGRLFGRNEPVIEMTQQVLTSAIEGWLAGLERNADHPFYRRNSGRIRYTGSWSVKLRSSGNHVNHIHSQGWISSAYYVSLPESVRNTPADSEDVSGCIQFGQPPAELELDLPPRRIIRPREGCLALFPSYMWHGTVPFEDDSPRVTIAFDMRAR